MREFSDRIGLVDFDWDIGKPLAQGSYDIFMDRWDNPPGTCVNLVGLGPADGKWFVGSCERDLFQEYSTVSIRFPEPELPEPEPPPGPEADSNEGLLTALGSKVIGGDAGGGGGAPASPGQFVWPTSDRRITSKFGPRGGRMHKGLDIAGNIGNPVWAAADGTVSFAGVQSGYGVVIYIEHADHFQTRYAHLSHLNVRAGVVVPRGQRIGNVGNTGQSSGPHLHFEVRRHGAEMNPQKYF